MANPYQGQEAPYGAKKALADVGLGQKEVPTTGGVRAGRPTGRPPVSGPPGAGPATGPSPAAAPASVDPVAQESFDRFAVASKAKQKADEWASDKTAGPWAQLLQQMATQAHFGALLHANRSTPNYNLEK